MYSLVHYIKTSNIHIWTFVGERFISTVIRILIVDLASLDKVTETFTEESIQS